MVGNIILKSTSIADQAATGRLIIELSKSVSDTSEGSEWMKFKADPKVWLYAAGYKYVGADAGPDERIPASVKIVPVYDTEDTMHIRVPWKGNVEPAPINIPNEDYGGSEVSRFPVLLARYFARKCR